MKNLRKSICAVLMLLTLTCCSLVVIPSLTAPITAEAATIKINKKKLTLDKGKTFQLKITGTKKKVTWKSSKPSVAKVTSKGKVTGKKAGTAKITARVNGKKYTCTVKVIDNSKIKFSTSVATVNLTIDQSKDVKILYTGDGTVYYDIENYSICSCEWSKKWKEDTTTLSITGKTSGSTVVTITNSSNSKKLLIKVNVKVGEITKFGSISGNVSYYYNRYIGNKADTGAYVILVPKNGAAKALSSFSIYGHNDQQQEKVYLYRTQVDSLGNYRINHVAVGEYRVLMISHNTSEGAWFDAYDDSISDASDSYYQNIYGMFEPQYLKTEIAKDMAGHVMYYKYYIKDISIYENDETTLSHDFGITYI